MKIEMKELIDNFVDSRYGARGEELTQEQVKAIDELVAYIKLHY